MSMVELTEWPDIVEMVEDKARTLLSRLNVKGPPVDAFALAKALGISVHIDRELGTRGYSRSRWGIGVIMLGSNNPGMSVRKHFTVAHEIGEMMLAGKVGQGYVEDASNHMAVSLLLPGDWFHRDAEATEFDLTALKNLYSTASNEIIAYRMVDFKPLIITIFDNGKLYRRKSSYATRAKKVFPLETKCMKAVNDRAEQVMLKDDGMSVTGWPIFKDGWKRVITKTEIEDFQ
ncbi:MAG: ImmA/IrrE family metallo-endopeptidase [Candidatus Brocadiales bacterium]|nr:ImmA/IrrE family metallo-endopeptidase [Candidatus Bathyanammoxibius sp.]